MSVQTLQRPATVSTVATMWRINPHYSKISFSVKHMMFATVHGRFNGFRGAISFDRNHPENTVVEAEIETATVDTGITKRDDHLRSADFFDVATYPTITFRSTRIEPINRVGRRWLMVGDLTLHGVTRSVELAVEQTGERSRGYAEAIEFTATTKINRKDFGMEFDLPADSSGIVIANEVKIEIAVQAMSGTR